MLFLLKMWKFVVCVGDSVESHCKIKIDATGDAAAKGGVAMDYEWNPCAMICKEDTRYLDFILRNKQIRLLVKRVPLADLDLKACKARLGDVELWYSVVMNTLVISVVKLYAFRNVATSILYNKIGNKVTAMINDGIFYLGRCQKYEARQLHSYYWFSSSQDDVFKGISPRNESSEDLESLKEAALDVTLIKCLRESVAAPQAQPPPLLSVYPYYPDNTHYENQQRRLPIVLPKAHQCGVTVDFYNFKCIPPRHAQVTIPKEDFVVVNALSRQSQSFNVGFINKEVKDDVTLQLFFEKDKTTNAITITSVALKGAKETSFEF